MSKTLLRMLAIAMLMFAGLGPFTRSHAFLATPGESSGRAMSHSTWVEVTFDGIMVFRQADDHYEVGIPDKTVAPDHEFKILDGKVPVPNIAQLMALGNTWSLDVVSNSGGRKDPDIKPLQVKKCNRLPDTIEYEAPNHVYDFCWIMDLENDFHGGQELKLIPGKLRPIILLNNGELYTKYKYDELRKQGPSGYSDYGFVAETIAVRVELEADEELVLRVGGKSGPDNVVFRLSASRNHTASIFNAPPPKDRMKRRSKRQPTNTPTHFHYYYSLFNNVNAMDYDIERKESGFIPLNRFHPGKSRALKDVIRDLTFDDQACGTILLGKSRGPLK